MIIYNLQIGYAVYLDLGWDNFLVSRTVRTTSHTDKWGGGSRAMSHAKCADNTEHLYASDVLVRNQFTVLTLSTIITHYA